MAKFRLLVACNLDGRRHKRGDIVERPDNWNGPTRTVRTVAQKYGARLGGTHREEALFERVDEIC